MIYDSLNAYALAFKAHFSPDGDVLTSHAEIEAWMKSQDFRLLSAIVNHRESSESSESSEQQHALNLKPETIQLIFSCCDKIYQVVVELLKKYACVPV